MEASVSLLQDAYARRMEGFSPDRFGRMLMEGLRVIFEEEGMRLVQQGAGQQFFHGVILLSCQIILPVRPPSWTSFLTCRRSRSAPGILWEGPPGWTSPAAAPWRKQSRWWSACPAGAAASAAAEGAHPPGPPGGGAVLAPRFPEGVGLGAEQFAGEGAFPHAGGGIGPIYGDKYMKKALRMEDLLDPGRLRRQLERLLDWGCRRAGG